jgi:hypothetical protein
MITLDDAFAVMDDKVIASLDLSMFSEDDLLNILLQRSEVLGDLNRPGKIIRAWSNGKEGPIRDVIAQMGETIARRTAAFIYCEFLALKPTLEMLKPKRFADIGCGYAFFDLFVAKMLNSDLILIDIESNDHRHFGYEQEGAAYTNLSKASALLSMNGIDSSRVTTINPQKSDLSAVAKVDVAASFVSCGYHYPASVYADFFRDGVTEDGALILDLRRRTADRQARELEEFGEISFLTEAAAGSARRMLVRKSAIKPA